MTTQSSNNIDRSMATRRTTSLHRAVAALLCSGFLAFSAHASDYTSDYESDFASDFVQTAQYAGDEVVGLEQVTYRGYRRGFRSGSRGYSKRRYSRRGYSRRSYSRRGYSRRNYSRNYYGYSRGNRYNNRYRTYRY